jgi:hypothetical protein
VICALPTLAMGLLALAPFMMNSSFTEVRKVTSVPA